MKHAEDDKAISSGFQNQTVAWKVLSTKSSVNYDWKVLKIRSNAIMKSLFSSV